MSNVAILGLTITFILVILGIIFPKSKKIYFLQILFFWMMLVFNNGGGDYLVHLNIYKSASNQFGIFNSGLYVFFCYLAKKMSIDFFSLNFILNSICVIIIYLLIKKNTKNCSITGSMLLIYPFVEDIIQKRFFIGSTFSLIGFYILFKKKQKHYKINSLILLIIGGLIHQAAFGYIILYILQQLDLKKIKKYFLAFIFLAYAMIPFIPILAQKIFPSSKVNLYFYKLRQSLVDGICWMILHLIFVLIISLINKKIKNDDKSIDNSFMDEIYKMNLISLVLLPLYYYEPTFIRLFRSLLIFDYIFVANKLIKYNGYKFLSKNQFTASFCWIGYLLCVYLMIYAFTGVGFNNLVVPEYENNIILKSLGGSKL